MELADTHDLGSCALGHGGSTPPAGTILKGDRMVEKEFWSYSDYETLMRKLVTKLKNNKRMKYIRNVYGIPRGGLPIAVHLSHFLKLNFLTNPFDKMHEETLIVDDIADTGITLKKYGSLYLFATLFYKPRSEVKPDFYLIETTKWIVFPWETSDEIPNR